MARIFFWEGNSWFNLGCQGGWSSSVGRGYAIVFARTVVYAFCVRITIMRMHAGMNAVLKTTRSYVVHDSLVKSFVPPVVVWRDQNDSARSADQLWPSVRPSHVRARVAFKFVFAIARSLIQIHKTNRNNSRNEIKRKWGATNDTNLWITICEELFSESYSWNSIWHLIIFRIQ